MLRELRKKLLKKESNSISKEKTILLIADEHTKRVLIFMQIRGLNKRCSEIEVLERMDAEGITFMTPEEFQFWVVKNKCM